jgi:hypothetical protein
MQPDVLQCFADIFPASRQVSSYNIWWTLCRYFVSISSAFNWHFADILRAFRQYLVGILPARDRFSQSPIACILQVFHQHFADILLTSCGYFTSISQAFHNHFTDTSQTFCKHFADISQALRKYFTDISQTLMALPSWLAKKNSFRKGHVKL